MTSLSFLPHPAHPGLVVSIHDVSPLTLPAVERMVAELNAIGIKRCSLLVIPDHHRRGHYLDDLKFCQWLQAREALGDEIVVHGYHHLRDRTGEESFWAKLTTRIYTAGEGEFFDIRGADAIWIISQARQELRRLGIETTGFIAPAWLLSEGGDRALQALDIEYTTRLSGIYDFLGSRYYASQSLVWSTRSLLRRLLSRCWNPWLLWRLRKSPLIRIGLHPVDIDHPGVWRQIVKLTRRALDKRPPLTYQEYVHNGIGRVTVSKGIQETHAIQSRSSSPLAL